MPRKTTASIEDESLKFSTPSIPICIQNNNNPSIMNCRQIYGSLTSIPPEIIRKQVFRKGWGRGGVGKLILERFVDDLLLLQFDWLNGYLLINSTV